MKFYFPKGFLWGAATSSHQVEGGNLNDWSEWEKESGKTLSGRAVEHYSRFESDFDLVSSMGHNAHRFSLEWSRIEPSKGVFNEAEIEHYREVLTSLRERKIEPFVTIWHWTLPLWLRDEGGLMSPDFPIYFARFVAKVVSEYSELVSFWMTLNEPTSVISHSYIKGEWPPNKKSLCLSYNVAKNLAQAHREAYRVIKEISPEANVGLGHIMTDYRGVFSSYWSNDFFFNLCGLDTQDYIGLQYYFTGGIFRKRAKEVSDMGWELNPEGIYRLLKKLKKFNKPIYITENGLADAKDQKREWYIKETLKEMARAIDEGVDLRGYFHWSLLDNFEWDKGFWPRFGLIEVDYETMERKIRGSALYYSEVCKSNFIER